MFDHDPFSYSLNVRLLFMNNSLKIPVNLERTRVRRDRHRVSTERLTGQATGRSFIFHYFPSQYLDIYINSALALPVALRRSLQYILSFFQKYPSLPGLKKYCRSVSQGTWGSTSVSIHYGAVSSTTGAFGA